MATSTERSFGEELNTWVQIIGIVIAAGWGVYTFVYKEFVIPQSAPVNITVDLQLKKIGASAAQGSGEEKPLIAVEMRVSATNPSSRIVYLFPTAWMAYGVNIDAVDTNASFADDAVRMLNSPDAVYDVGTHVQVTETSVVAVGQLFPDESLKPNETATRTLLIFVPPGKYDYLDVVAVMPSMGKEGDVKLEWQFDEANGLQPVLYRLGETGERTELARNSHGVYEDAELELQNAASLSVLSLWE